MKNIKHYLTLCLAILSVFLLVSCGTPAGEKLDVPSVTISETGLASWEAIPNAKEYRYII